MVFDFLKRKKEDSSIDEDLSLLKSSLDLTNNSTDQPILKENKGFPELNNSNSLNNDFLSTNNTPFNNPFSSIPSNNIPLNNDNPLLNNRENEQTITFLKKREDLNHLNFQNESNLNNFSNSYNEKEVLLKLEVIESKIEKLESKIDMIYNLLMYNKR